MLETSDWQEGVGRKARVSDFGPRQWWRQLPLPNIWLLHCYSVGSPGTLRRMILFSQSDSESDWRCWNRLFQRRLDHKPQLKSRGADWGPEGTPGRTWQPSPRSHSQPSLLTFPLSSTTLLDKAELRLILTEIWEPGARDSRKPVRRTGELVVSPAHRSHTDVCLKIFHGIVYHLYWTSPAGDFTMTRSSAHTQIMRYLYLLNV